LFVLDDCECAISETAVSASGYNAAETVALPLI
jgi:hypothetical protein